jgi:hypothetical protein
MKSMKTTRICAALFLGAAGLALAGPLSGGETGRAIDWPAFLSRHDPVWTQAPKERGASAFIGNGMLGSTIWSARDEALHWDLGRCDVYDTGASVGNRMPIGKLIMKLEGKPADFSMHQSLFRAEATGTITTDRGKVAWRSIVPHDRMVGLIEYTASGKEGAKFEFFQLPVVNSNALRNGMRDFLEGREIDRRAKRIIDFSDPAYTPVFAEMMKDKRYKKLFDYPDPKGGMEKNVGYVVQPFPKGGGYVVAWGVKRYGGRKYLCASTVDSFDAGTPDPGRAVGRVQKALDDGYEKLAAPHYKWWERYYAKSFVSIPDKKVERYYWMQIYKMGAATRRDGVVLDQIGPWLRATAWARVWCNINIEIAYHSMMTCNHLEQCKPFVDLFGDPANWRKFENAVPEKYRGKGAMAVGRTMDIRGNTGWNWEFGNLAWVAHDFWMYGRRTGDDALMREKIYPLLKGAAAFMMNALEKDGEGTYHVPPDISPEYTNDRCPDNNYNLALLRWSLRTLQFMNRHYGLNDPDKARWDDVQAHLAEFPVDGNGLMIAPGVPFEKTHRHYSHLLAFFPLRVLDPDNPEDLALCRKSYDHWVALSGPGPKRAGWNSFSYFGAAGMAAWLGDGDAALRHLREGAATTTPNTFFRGPGPAIESVLAGTVGLGEMLLQSATSDPGDFRLRIFPAIPGDWKDVRFEHLRAEGAFDVSATLRGGRLAFVEITSLAGNPCRVEARFGGKVEVLGEREFSVKKQKDRHGREYLEIDLKKGETARLVSGEG